MLSKKYFLTGGPTFSAPLVRPKRAKVRDHIDSQEGDHRASYMSCRGLQRRRQPKTDFREILRTAQFSIFRQHRPKYDIGYASQRSRQR